MELITTRAELKKRLLDVLAMEIGARDMYQEDVTKKFTNARLVKAISEIWSDEVRHIEIVKEIIELI